MATRWLTSPSNLENMDIFLCNNVILLSLFLLADYLKRFMAVPVPNRNWETGCPGPSGKLENIFLDRQGGWLSHFIRRGYYRHCKNKNKHFSIPCRKAGLMQKSQVSHFSRAGINFDHNFSRNSILYFVHSWHAPMYVISF